MLGASAAFHLTLAGAEVVVADQGHAGRATAAGAGIVSPWSSGRADPDWRRIADAGALLPRADTDPCEVRRGRDGLPQGRRPVRRGG